jgi:uncharacterized protein (DUF885 family)
MDREGTRRVATIVDRFVSAHFEAHPEDGSSLGVREHAARMSVPTRDAGEHELVAVRRALAEAGAIEAERARGAIALDLDASLDLDALVRAARFHERRLERDLDAETLELAALPNSAVQHGALHARTLADVEALVLRARLAPAALAAQAANLRRGVREGRGPDREVVETFVERILPGAARALETVPRDLADRLGPEVASDAVVARLGEATTAASEAYRTLARVVAGEILPKTRAHLALGEDEVAFRLRDVMGVETTIAELVTDARGRLDRAHREVVAQARLAGDDVRDYAGAKDAVLALFGPKPATIEEALAAYREQIEAATRVARAIVPIPDDLALGLDPLPEGIADGAGFTNWPAPLLDPTGRGHALYARDPAAHPRIMAKQLAIHECIPGHYLQSAIWQRQRSRPVRFLGVQDDVAMSVGYFGTMVSVEGWAVHMEDEMVALGFMEPGRERMFSAWCDAVRAMRVLLDLGLHAEGRSADEMAAQVAEATLLSEGWARQQVLRSKRIPLQSSTYQIGAMEIEALQKRARPKMSALDFHAKLLAFGPVPTSRLRVAF